MSLFIDCDEVAVVFMFFKLRFIFLFIFDITGNFLTEIPNQLLFYFTKKLWYIDKSFFRYTEVSIRGEDTLQLILKQRIQITKCTSKFFGTFNRLVLGITFFIFDKIFSLYFQLPLGCRVHWLKYKLKEKYWPK